MRILKLFALFGMFILLCSYYVNDSVPEVNYRPVLMSRSNLEKSIKYVGPRDLINPGKIYLKGHLFFIVEKYKGIHVIDNSNPEKPVKTGFIQIPGCMDLAIKGASIYADNAVDLVTISFENLDEVVITGRVKDAFPELTPPGWDYVPTTYNSNNRPEGTIIVAWELSY